jgi:hypothetical protein
MCSYAYDVDLDLPEVDAAQNFELSTFDIYLTGSPRS